jgi:hypothetical protein
MEDETESIDRTNRLSISTDSDFHGVSLVLVLFLTIRKCHGLMSLEVKILDVTLYKRLKFASHTTKSIEKADKVFRILYSFLNGKSKLCLYKDHSEQVLQDNQKSPLPDI